MFDGSEVSLEDLPNLRACQLEFSLREMFVVGNMSLPWINTLVTQFSSPRLENVTLRIKADNMEDLRALDSECGVRDVSVVHFDDFIILDWERIGGALENARALKSFVVEGRGDATRFLENISTRCSLRDVVRTRQTL